MPPKSSTFSSVSTALLWWMRMRREGAVGGGAARLGAMDVDPLGADPVEDVSGHLGRLGVIDLQRLALAEEVGAEADVVELVPQHADVVEPAHRRVHVAVGRAVGKLHAAGVGVGEDVVAHHHLVDGVLRGPRP